MADTKNIYEKLRAVQLELKAPKSQRNSFGNYNYRSCEDILEAVKPLCEKHGLILVVTDKLVYVGERYYVEAMAAVYDGPENIQAYGYAREEETKKGMDGAQITGSASSYARKYSLNGLFLIDDTKDADSQDNRSQASSGAPKPQPKAPEPSDKPMTNGQKVLIFNKLKKHGISDENMTAVLTTTFGVNAKTMTFAQAQDVLQKMSEGLMPEDVIA